jgi:hypothetical protein
MYVVVQYELLLKLAIRYCILKHKFSGLYVCKALFCLHVAKFPTIAKLRLSQSSCFDIVRLQALVIVVAK